VIRWLGRTHCAVLGEAVPLLSFKNIVLFRYKRAEIYRVSPRQVKRTLLTWFTGTVGEEGEIDIAGKG
jgi:hypothetical protein